MSNSEKMQRIAQLVNEFRKVVREGDTESIFVNFETETEYFSVNIVSKNSNSVEFYCSRNGETKQVIRKENV